MNSARAQDRGASEASRMVLTKLFNDNRRLIHLVLVLGNVTIIQISAITGI